ncbi:MAG: DUF6624 domain-containing protein [Chitinophagales bacterium]|mgnify:CR=1 FL=1
MKSKLVFLAVFFCTFMYAQDYGKLVDEANALYDKKEYKQSLEKMRDAFKIKSDYDNDLYNGACIASLAGDKKLAFKWLYKALHLGWVEVKHIKVDTDLTNLHTSKKWNKLIFAMQKKKDKIEARYNKPLKEKLETILISDQGIRRDWDIIEKKYGVESTESDSIRKIAHTIDSINLIAIKEVLDKEGWLGADIVGKQGNMCLFLVIQHSDLQTQKKYLPMMREAVKNNKAKASSLALLEDRVALGEKKPQTYGSQIGYDKSTKKFYVLLLSDPDNVDKRRKKMGLGLLADYVKNWGIIWNVEDYKKELPRLIELLNNEK